jgi:hypothetical protein
MALPASQTDNFNVYSFDVGQVHFVSILAVRGGQDLPDSQVEWIIDDIEDAKGRGQVWIIPYMHVSAFADGTSHPSNISLRNQLGPVFEQLGIHLVISSHDQNYERTYPLVNVGQGSPVVTDTNLTGYDANDGIVWLKVSPAGKLSSIDGAFSAFQTNPPPYWTAARDDTLHHFARFVVSADGTLTTQIYATPGNDTPSFVYDTFTYSLNSTAPNGAHAQATQAVDAAAPETSRLPIVQLWLSSPNRSNFRPPARLEVIPSPLQTEDPFDGDEVLAAIGHLIDSPADEHSDFSVNLGTSDREKARETALESLEYGFNVHAIFEL